MEKFITSQEKFQCETKSHLQELDKQVSQINLNVRRLQSEGKLSSQTELNSKENVSEITL